MAEGVEEPTMTTTVDWTDKVWTWPAGTREGGRPPGQWLAGPWDDEPDKVQWVDAASDLDCLIVRGPMGALCGYVGVSEGHPLFRKSYGSCIVDGCEESHWDDRPEGHSVPESMVQVHGGLTFSSMCVESDRGEGYGICHVPEPGRPDKVFWFGFDCGHFMDIVPGMVSFERHMGFLPLGASGEVYRDIHYVRENCESLAEQLAVLARQ